VLLHKEELCLSTHVLYYQVPERSVKWDSSRPKCEGVLFCCVDFEVRYPRTLLLIEVITILLQSNFIYFTICVIPTSLRTLSLIEVISVPLYSTLFKLQ
jgi:hypothetical protein